MSSTPSRRVAWLWKAPTLIVLLSWVSFCGLAAIVHYTWDEPAASAAFAVAGIAPMALAWKLSATRRRWWPWLAARLGEHTEQIDALPARRLPLWIALSAGLALYVELVLIRYHGSCFAIFGFFKNVSLLSCFLGLGVGYALGGVRPLVTPLVLPMLAAQLIVMHALRYTAIAVALQNPVSEQLAMGLHTAEGWLQALPTYAFMVWSFSFNALCLVPLGQLASRLMARSPRLPAYGWNLLGSIGGIVAFWGLSWLWTPPAVWFAVAVGALAVFLRRMLAPAMVCGVAIVAALSFSPLVDRYDVYSPYQILTVHPNDNGMRSVMVSHYVYQQIHDFRPSAGRGDEVMREYERYYQVPYEIRPAPKRVLVVGSGTGNDVAAALRNGAGHVDAVEIDPAVLELGRRLHPEMPYQSSRVTAHVEDARAFVRYTGNRYDLIVYGLLDSHTALSGMSGVRLDSFVYTVQAFREARARLADDGILCLSFAVIDDKLGQKLYRMLAEAFDGRGPTSFVTSSDAHVFVIGKDPGRPIPLPGDVQRVTTEHYASLAGGVDISTDDWPFFYMPVRTYPVSYLVVIAALLAVAWAFIRPVLGQGGGWQGMSAATFLLGAGFMLLETKAITELALHYGSTWVVISVVIVAILVMAFLANLVVMRWPGIPRGASYALLLLSLAASLWFSLAGGSIGSQWATRLLAPAMITLPLLFSGLIFSQELAAARSVAAALGSNLIGAMVGGCLEYNSMYFGYHSLYVLAMAIYALSMIVSLSRGRRAREPGREAEEPLAVDAA